MDDPPRTLDLPEKQVLVDFFEDADGLRWHHRLLLQATPTAGVWIASTPDYEVQRLDLNQHRVLALGRNVEFPAGRRGEIYHFDNPIPEDELRSIRVQATDLLRILGVVGSSSGVAEGGMWRVADPALDSFGDEIPRDVVGDDSQFVAAPAGGSEAYPSALALIDGCWAFAQCIEPDALDEWRMEKLSAHGRDDRVLADVRDPVQKGRMMSFTEAYPLYHEATSPPFQLKGQRVTFEYLRALRAVGMEWMPHHLDFIHKSGLSPLSGTSRAHRRISEAMQMFQQHDQLNLPSLAGVEVLLRYLVQIETAVARNPRCPDFQDLDILCGTSVNEHGGLILPDFNKYVAQIQRDEAFTLKQRRQWHEEQTALQRAPPADAGSGASGGPDDGGGRGKGRGRGGRGNRGGGGGRAGSSGGPAGAPTA